MPPDTPNLTLSLRASLFHIIHDFYHYDVMTLLKNFCARHWMESRERASYRAPHLLNPGLPLVVCLIRTFNYRLFFWHRKLSLTPVFLPLILYWKMWLLAKVQNVMYNTPNGQSTKLNNGCLKMIFVFYFSQPLWNIYVLKFICEVIQNAQYLKNSIMSYW